MMRASFLTALTGESSRNDNPDSEAGAAGRHHDSVIKTSGDGERSARFALRPIRHASQDTSPRRLTERRGRTNLSVDGVRVNTSLTRRMTGSSRARLHKTEEGERREVCSGPALSSSRCAARAVAQGGQWGSRSFRRPRSQRRRSPPGPAAVSRKMNFTARVPRGRSARARAIAR